MANKSLTSEIATLGRMCGISPEYRDNGGRRRRTSFSTYQALLAAMRVPCSNHKEIRAEIARRQKQSREALLPPAGVVWLQGGRLVLPLNAAAIKTELRPGLTADLEFTSEAGQTWSGPVPLKPSGSPGHGSWSLRLPDTLAPGYYHARLSLTTTTSRCASSPTSSAR